MKERKERLYWIAEKDYGGRTVQIYAVCRKHAKEILNRRPAPAKPTFFTRISRREADRILRREMGWGAWADKCDLCEV